MKLFLLTMAAKPAGRIVMHLLCMFRSHQWAWHLAGIAREFAHRR